MFGKDPMTLTVGILCANVSMEKLALQVHDKFKTRGTVDTWTRLDLHTKNLQENKQERTDLGNVAYRVTADARSGDVIDVEDVMTVNREVEYRLVYGGFCDLVTVLLLKSVSGQDDHLDEHDHQEEER